MSHAITIQNSVAPALADDARVFYSRVVALIPTIEAEHPHVMHLLASLPRQIDMAAAYQQSIRQQLEDLA